VSLVVISLCSIEIKKRSRFQLLFISCGLLLESWLERVTDRNSKPVRIARRELVVVMNLVHVGFGTHEDIVPNIEAKAGPEVSGKMVAAHVISAAYECAVNLTVETKIFSTESNHDFWLYPLANSWRIDGVKVIQNGTERKRVRVQVLTGSPGDFTLDAELMMVQEKNIRANAGEQSAALRHDIAPCQIHWPRGRGHRTKTKSYVQLLRICHTRSDGQHAYHQQ
jgi:hypothetical protein